MPVMCVLVWGLATSCQRKHAITWVTFSLISVSGGLKFGNETEIGALMCKSVHEDLTKRSAVEITLKVCKNHAGCGAMKKATLESRFFHGVGRCTARGNLGGLFDLFGLFHLLQAARLAALYCHPRSFCRLPRQRDPAAGLRARQAGSVLQALYRLR